MSLPDWSPKKSSIFFSDQYGRVYCGAKISAVKVVKIINYQTLSREKQKEKCYWLDFVPPQRISLQPVPSGKREMSVPYRVRRGPVRPLRPRTPQLSGLPAMQLRPCRNSPGSVRQPGTVVPRFSALCPSP